MSTRRIAIVVQGAALALACLLVPGAAHAVVFADGMLHIIDAANSFPFEGVDVLDGPGPSTTTVELVPGGVVGGDIRPFGMSILRVEGGEAGIIALFDSSSLEMSGGMALRVGLIHDLHGSDHRRELGR